MTTRFPLTGRVLVLMALLLALALPSIAAAAGPCTTVCYVNAATGNDANDGDTPATAKKTIQAAVTQVSAGGTVNVAAGVYAENVVIAKSLTLTGAGQTNDAAGTVLEGTGLNGSGIFINTGITNVTIQNLRVQHYKLSPAAGVYANGQNHNFTVQNVTSDDNGLAGSNGGGVYMNGPVDNVLIDHVTATNSRNRGIVIWNGFKTHITITNNTVTGNNCCGIELQDGTASGVTVTGNTVTGNLDSGMAFIGLTSGAGPNLIANNTLVDNGRFGIEIKLPNGTGATSGDGSIVVEDNNVSMTAPVNDGINHRDAAGISAYRRGWVAGNNNVDIPTGVVIRDNTVSGYQQPSTSDGFGIVVEGLNMHVSGNTLNNNDVGVQVQAGHLPYTANTNVDGNQVNLADTYFGRGNSPVGCAVIGTNTFSGNAVNVRNVNAGGGVVTNTNTAETFCSIQAAINDADTANGHTLQVSPGVYAENVIVNKSLTINGANAGVSPNDTVNPLNPNGARGPESEVTVTGGNSAFRIGAANVTIDGFKFTDSAVAQANVQTPMIGAGVNFGGDAPGVKILNNLFYQTSRNLVYFNGPAIMQGGTVDDNRVQNPTRPDTGCVGATAPSSCGHQLFNLWQTNNLSFQDNVVIANPASGDRMRTLNITNSTNVLIAGNTVRYTCIYTCISIPGTATNVEIKDNDLVTDVGNVIQFFAPSSGVDGMWLTGTVNIHHNILTTGADFPVVVDNPTADLDNVHVNRNAISGAYHVRNGKADLSVVGAETLDVTCNWWGSAAGPNPANFFGPSDYTPWLYTSDLDGACFIGGTITVTKQTTPNGDPAVFEFDPSWPGPNFTLSDGQSATSPILPAGPYSVAEVNLVAPWVLTNATCDNAATPAAEVVNPANITLADGDAWTCTFENKNVPLCTTHCYVDAVNGNDAANGGTSPSDAFKTVQKGVNTVQTGGTVHVLAGTYTEQVTIAKSLTLVGADAATTIIKAPASIPAAAAPNSVVVKIAGAGVSVDLSKVTVSGPGPTGCGSIGYGIFVRDGAYANIHDSRVLDVRDQPISGCQNGVAIQVGAASLNTNGTADITNNTISGYQKNGINVSGAASSATIAGNTVTGAGAVAFIAQNGIQVSGGATADITGNTVSGHSYTPFTYVSTGMLLYGPGAINTDGNTVSENQVGIYIVDASGTHQNNDVDATAAGTGSAGFWGIVVDAPPPTRQPSPAGAEEAGPTAAAPAPQAPVQTVVLRANALTSDGSAGGVGIEADGGYGSFDIDLTVTKNLIHGWDYGVVVYECTSGCTGTGFVDVDVNRNSIAGNVSNGVENISTLEVDATCNWWGAADGPGPVGPGSGDGVSADVDFTPWLASSDLNGLCADGVFVSADKLGVTSAATGGVAFGSEDVLKWDGAVWSVWFDGSAAGLTAKNAMHNIDAMYIPDPNAPVFYLSFTQNARVVPGIVGKVDGMDLVKWDGAAFSLYFDGSDVGLTNKTQEKLDALHILPGNLSPVGANCQAYLLLSTQGPGSVPDPAGGKKPLKFGGEDVLGFCLINAGANTTGVWHIALDGSTQDMPKNSLDSLSASADGMTYYLTTRATFHVDSAHGGHSMVYVYDVATQTFSGPIFDAPANGLPRKVDALEVTLLP
ncbi:right-handed parallel beta-helix repeat-containing protein [Promineifilum sp.]|uniref:right-handed parallel beta-helix repeat-containing protein n=1 Tax=Promineifilum sp. TaxID=2664178 RepID=UPI0035B23C6F